MLSRAVLVRCSSSWSLTTGRVLEQQLKDMKAAGTYKSERVILGPQGARVRVKDGTVLNFCANNYLGLSSHPEIIAAAKKALDEFGAGLSSVRFICGTQSIHKNLESKISKFHSREDTILYPSCFDANAGLFEAILSDDDALFSDELNHASIVDGVRLCKAKQKFRYKHRDMADLEEKLASSQGARQRLIITDGVFSMDGNIAPLREICDLAEKYKAVVFVDECHATGLVGKTGRGTEELLDIGKGRIDIINSTLGKALGGAAGGYTTGRKELVDLLRNKARPYLFSNSLPPPVVAAGSMALDLVMKDTTLTDTLVNNTKHFRTRMIGAGFTILGDPTHPIAPVLLGDAKLASSFADDMLNEGIYVIGFSYPVVPKGKARIRVQISAVHTTKDIDKAVDSFIKVGRKLSVVQ